MPKKTLTVTAPDGTIFTRKTDRRYTDITIVEVQ